MASWQHTKYGEQILEEMRRKVEIAERVHALYRPRWDEVFSQYRTFKAWDNWKKTNEADRDSGLQFAKREWGADLQIPVAFATVETILPRALSNRPRMLILPRDRESVANVDHMRLTIDAQQEQIGYELKAAEAGKNGFILGLGITKPFWRTNKRKSRKLAEPFMRTDDGPQWVEEEFDDILFDDPDVDVVDPYDWMWSPQATSMDDLDWCFHRMWRNTGYIWHKITNGEWKPELTENIEAEDIDGSSASNVNYDMLWAKRMEAMGFQSRDINGQRGLQLHEVMEFHDGDRCIVMVDRQFIVNCGKNPLWRGQIPFSIYRPTTAGTKQLPGIGEVEPIRHLAQELSTLRGQRRDAATFALMPPVFGDDGGMDVNKIVWAPGVFNPVQGNPNELLMKMDVGDIPASSYQEEDRIQGDIERVSGIGEPVTGASEGGSQTATGVQLTVAAASIRIQAKTRRLEAELIKRDASLFVDMNQQYIIESKGYRKPGPPVPGANPESRWEWFEVGPAELAGKFDVLPEGGSTAPENVGQDRADAQMVWAIAGNNPGFDQSLVAKWVLEKAGIKNASQWVVDQSQTPPMETWAALADVLAHSGRFSSQQEVDQVVQAVQTRAVQAEQQSQQSGGKSPQQQGQPAPGAQANGQVPEQVPAPG